MVVMVLGAFSVLARAESSLFIYLFIYLVHFVDRLVSRHLDAVPCSLRLPLFVLQRGVVEACLSCLSNRRPRLFPPPRPCVPDPPHLPIEVFWCRCFDLWYDSVCLVRVCARGRWDYFACYSVVRLPSSCVTRPLHCCCCR